jgi:hypothetical protein
MKFEKWLFLLTVGGLWAVSSAGSDDETIAPAALAVSPDAANGAAAKIPATMSPAEKKELQSKQERFYRLDPAAQDRLRRLHDDLSQAPDAARLQSVLTRYAGWLQTLPSGQRADLLSLPPAERIAEIRRVLQEQTASRMRSYVPRKLSDDDLRTIASWVEQMVQRREPELLERMPAFKEHLDNISDAKRRIQALAFMVHRSGFRRDWLHPTAEEIDQLKTQLSAEARQDLDKAKAEGRLPELTDAWTRAAMFSRLTGPPADKEQLRKFFNEELDPQQREFLESLPPERMQAELVRMYYAHRFRRDGYRDWPGLRKPGGGLRGPGPPSRFGPPGIRDSNGGDRSPERPPLRPDTANGNSSEGQP